MSQSELSRLLSPVLGDPKARDSLAKALSIELERIEAENQRAQAEARFKVEHGERASHQDELKNCADGIEGCLHWFDNWCWTFDPRLISQNKVPFVPFKLWPKQREFIRYLHARVSAGNPFLLEKSRDQGATYLLVGYAIWRWLFTPGFKTTFCSRDAENVDAKGNPDSIFEKLRIILHRLPSWMMPQGFNPRTHDNIMLLTNPATGGTITGVTGDNPGRGGRSTLAIVDEAAFIAHPAKVEAAMSGTTDCVGWVSTPNPESGGLANFFARKRAAYAQIPGMIFTLHWRDDPRKDDAWAGEKRATMADPSTWDAEYEISYTSATEGVAVPAKWVQSAVDLWRMIGPSISPSNYGVTGGDVGAGRAKSVCVHRFGPVILSPQRRQEADTTDTAYWMLDCMVEMGTKFLNFDAPGVGQGVLSTLSKIDRKLYPSLDGANGVNTGDAPSNRVWEDGVPSTEKFGNLKAELWWLTRGAFQRSYLHFCFLEEERCRAQGVPYRGDKGRQQKLDEIAVMPDDPIMKMQLSTPKWFRNSKGKIVIETKQQLAQRRIPSPDDADALVLSYLEPPLDPAAGVRLQPHEQYQENPFVVQ